MKLLNQPTFRPLFLTQFLGAFNDNFFKNALIMLITFNAAEVLNIPSAELVPLAGGLFILPYFLFSGTAGQVADRYDKARLIRLIKIVEIGLMGLALLGLVVPALPFLFVVLFGMGLHSTFFAPLKFSILPQHVAPAQLVAANALVEAGTFVAILLGTIAGGVIITIPGWGRVLTGLGTLGVAIAGYLTARGIPAAPPVDSRTKVQWDPVRPTWEILKFTRARRDVFLMIIGSSWFWLFGALMLLEIPSYCKDELNANENVVSLFLTCFSLGLALGALACDRASRGHVERGLVVVGAVGISVFTAILALIGRGALLPGPARAGAIDVINHPRGIMILIDLVLLAGFAGVFIVPLNTLVQELTPRAMLSRVIAGNNILNALFMVGASTMLFGLVKLGASVPQVFLSLAVLNVAATAPLFCFDRSYVARVGAWLKGARSSR